MLTRRQQLEVEHTARRIAAGKLVKALLALAGGATFKLEPDGSLTVKPPGSTRRTVDELRGTLPAVLQAAADLAELCGIEAIETAGLLDFADLIAPKSEG